jgi:hypothetical protein
MQASDVAYYSNKDNLRLVSGLTGAVIAKHLCAVRSHLPCQANGAAPARMYQASSFVQLQPDTNAPRNGPKLASCLQSRL